MRIFLRLYLHPSFYHHGHYSYLMDILKQYYTHKSAALVNMRQAVDAFRLGIRAWLTCYAPVVETEYEEASLTSQRVVGWLASFHRLVHLYTFPSAVTGTPWSYSTSQMSCLLYNCVDFMAVMLIHYHFHIASCEPHAANQPAKGKWMDRLGLLGSTCPP